MAKLNEVFDATTVPEREEFTIVEPGMYDAMIVSSEKKTTKSGGEMYVLELEIQGGEHSGQKLFERLNIVNSNPKAVEIAFRVLAEIVKAVGKTTIRDTEELHNKRMKVEVMVEPPTPYEKDGVMQPGKPQNSIKKFLPSSGTGSAPKTSPDVKVEQKSDQKSESSAVPPWKRKQQ